MDRRGLRRTKAAHINPIPLFVMAVLLYATNLVFRDYDAPWWSFPLAFLISLITGFSAYLVQSRYAENSTPIYFAVYIFLIAILPQMAVFGRGQLAAFCVILAFVFTIKFICEDKRQDYMACTAFCSIIASIITPSGIFLLPLFWFLLLEESDRKVKDSLVFIISSLITGAIIFGVLYLFRNIDGALEAILGWKEAVCSFSITYPDTMPLTDGLFLDWKSAAFASSLTKCLVVLDGIIITIVYLSRKNSLKSDDLQISKVCILITLFSIALNYFYTDQQQTWWTVIAAMMSVPTTHFLSSEGKHILISIFIVLAFLVALVSIIPVLELL